MEKKKTEDKTRVGEKIFLGGYHPTGGGWYMYIPCPPNSSSTHTRIIRNKIRGENMRGVQKMGKNGQKNTEHMVQNRDATQKLKKG